MITRLGAAVRAVWGWYERRRVAVFLVVCVVLMVAGVVWGRLAVGE
ncbi:hypothetical protein [Actinoplanes sp. NBRC 101535]|nr:hypothetical protein [Actinoplanes sp. NBRC 101535]